MSRIYALANQKGGVGKTTTAINVAACIAEAGARVLLVDFDPQANATTGLGLRPPRGRSTYDLLHGAAMRDIIVETSTPGLALAPAHPDLAAAAVELPDREDRDRILGAALAEVGDEFPYVLVDCPPSLGMLTLNALAAANRLIVPVQCEYYALEGLAQLLETVELIRARGEPAAVADRAAADDARRSHAAVGRRGARGAQPLRAEGVLERHPARRCGIAEAPSHGRPISTYDPRSTGAEAYYRVALEVVERG